MSLRRRVALFVVGAAVALALAACGGQVPTPHADLMGDTTVGKNRCQVGQSNDRPFIVEWDATDIASFESKAARDVVFVKVTGCDLEVLDCRDDGIPGKYGAYDAPQWTSGVVEGFSIRNEGDLYAKLPFGASSLAATVKGGNELELSYFVSGSRPALRSMIYKADIAANPLCASATHFVAGYDLGAFDLAQKGQSAESADMKVGPTGNAGGGGNLAHSEAHLRTAGSLADCTKESARELSRCRVPIRLALRAVADGSNPTPAPATANNGGGALPPGITQDFLSLMQSAQRKMQLRDGPGCLMDLDRAEAIHSDSMHNLDMVRSSCEMLVGKCEDGRRRYRAFLARTAPQLTAEQADNSVFQQGVNFCEGKEATPLERATRDNKDLIEALHKQDTPRCNEKGKDLAEAWPKIGPDADIQARRSASGALRYGAECIAKYSGDCTIGKKLWELNVGENYASSPELTRQHLLASYPCPAGTSTATVGSPTTAAPAPPKKKKRRKPAAPPSAAPTN